jgi:hypothetical protein
MLWYCKLIRDAFVAAVIIVLTSSLGPNKLGAAAETQGEAHEGLIDGIVLYEDGRPANGATVYAIPIGVVMAAVVPHSDSDKDGRFAIHIQRSWFGKFGVATKKDDEDYPDMSLQFYSAGKFERVTLTPEQSAASVTIRLGPKAGVLWGTVTDAETGEGLNPCVDLKRASGPNNFLSGSGLVNAKYRLLIPSDTDVLIKLYLNGYKSWYYPGTSDRSSAGVARLGPGDERKIDIKLQQDGAFAESGCGARRRP